MAKNILTYAPVDLMSKTLIAGLDEVGRGPGAGPVVTAAVIFKPEFKSDLIDDSKKLTEKQRRTAYDLIIKNAIAYNVQSVSAKVINEIGINAATFKAMHQCINEIINNFNVVPTHLLVDGIVFSEFKHPDYQIPHTCVPKGDGLYLSIGAASILAKVKRDDYMKKVHEIHPEYGFDTNFGYLSAKHIEAIKKHGPTIYHRTQYIKNFI